MRNMVKTLVAIALTLVAGVAVIAQDTGPRISVTQPGDSLRVVASWKRGCDLRGCADTSLVAWTINGNPAREAHSTAVLTDTVWVAAPKWGDSVVLVVRVSSVRRGYVSDAAEAKYTVVSPDAAPPKPDSLKIDTLALRIAMESAAERDSFPVVLVRDTSGMVSGSITAGEQRPLCALARNRYTGKVWTLVPFGTPEAEQDAIEERCERARQQVEAERDS